MTLSLKNESGKDLDFPLKDDFYALVKRTLEEFSCPFDAEVNLLITTEEKIRELNREFRGTDRVTDVLSFPLLELSPPGDFSTISRDEVYLFNPESFELLLGDIVICEKRAKEQAEEYGHGLRREFAFLIVHSMLHLLGFDHETEKEEGEMCALQEKILSSLGINR